METFRRTTLHWHLGQVDPSHSPDLTSAFLEYGMTRMLLLNALFAISVLCVTAVRVSAASLSKSGSPGGKMSPGVLGERNPIVWLLCVLPSSLKLLAALNIGFAAYDYYCIKGSMERASDY